MKKYYFLIFTLFVVYCSVNAQYNDNYELLRCSGAVPKDWQNSINQKFEEKKVDKKAKNEVKKTKKEKNVFYLETTFSIDNMLRSGWVLYNDPITAYLEKIKEELQKKNPEIPQNIRIYTLRTPEVNAFATDAGIIFVTMGLMAKVNNEAELALIIGHEIGHVMKQHSLNKFLEAKRLDKENKKSFDVDVYERKLLKFHAYAKENETEADEIGLNFLLKTDYATQSLENVYEVLRLAETPFAESAFPFEILETEFMKIKPYVSLPAIKPIEGMDETKEDSMSTHPNIAARKNMLKNRLANISKGQGSAFLVSEETFKNVQLMSRFEMPMAYIDCGMYEEAAYISAYLLKSYPNNIYLKKTLAKALYKIAKSNTSTKSRERKDIEDVEGALVQVYALSDKLTSKEWNILTTSYIWGLTQKHPKEEEITLMCKDLMADMHEYISDRTFFKGFEAWAEEKNKAESPVEKPKEETKISDGERTKESKGGKWGDSNETVRENKMSDKGILEYAFLEYVEDTVFINWMETAYKTNHKQNDNIEYEQKEKVKAYVKKQMKKGWSMGLENVVMLSPVYWSFSKDLLYNKSKALLLSAEKKQYDANEIIHTLAKQVGIEVALLGEKDLKEGDTERFNDYIMVKRWMYEALDAKEMNVMPMYHDELMKIAQKYKSSHFVYTDIVNVKYSNNVLRTMLTPWWILVPPLIPVLFYENYKHHHQTRIVSYALDIKTGRIIPLKHSLFSEKDSDTFLSAHIYDILLQLHTKK